MGQPAAEWELLVAIDAEIARLATHAAATADEFAASLDRIQIDRLLERRFELMETSA